MEMQKNIPSLRFPEFADEWERTKLGKLFFNRRQKGNNSLPIYSVTQDRGLVPRNSLDRNFGNDAQPEDNLLVESNDIVYNMMRMWQGAVGIAFQKCMVSPAYVVLKPLENANPLFFINYFQKNRSIYLFTAYSYGLTSDRLRLYYKDFSDINFYTPTPSEQNKITTFLTAIDDKLAQLKQKKTLLEQYKKGVMQKIFDQEIRFKDDDENDYPDWKMKQLGEIATIATGSSNRVDSSLEGDYTFFDRSQDIRSSSIFLFDGEAIIVAGEGQEFAPKYFIGKFDLHQRTYSIMNFINANGKFLFYQIDKFRYYFFSQSVGSTVKSLRLPMFERMPIQLPCIDEQTKIANCLTAIDEKLNQCNNQISKTEQYKKGLLQQMFV